MQWKESIKAIRNNLNGILVFILRSEKETESIVFHEVNYVYSVLVKLGENLCFKLKIQLMSLHYNRSVLTSCEVYLNVF